MTSTYLKLGNTAKIRLVDGTETQGTLRYISRDASSATRTFRIEVAIPNEDKALPAGMTAEITLLAEPTGLHHAAAFGGDAELGRRPRHPRRRQGQQGRVLPDRSRRRYGAGSRAGGHSCRCAGHRRRAGPGSATATRSSPSRPTLRPSRSSSARPPTEPDLTETRERPRPWISSS